MLISPIVKPFIRTTYYYFRKILFHNLALCKIVTVIQKADSSKYIRLFQRTISDSNLVLTVNLFGVSYKPFVSKTVLQLAN